MSKSEYIFDSIHFQDQRAKELSKKKLAVPPSRLHYFGKMKTNVKNFKENLDGILKVRIPGTDGIEDVKNVKNRHISIGQLNVINGFFSVH